MEEATDETGAAPAFSASGDLDTALVALRQDASALKAAVADTTRATSDVEEYLTWELAARREIVDELQARIDAKTRECEGETRGMEDRVRSARERADGETRALTARVDALRETEPDISRRHPRPAGVRRSPRCEFVRFEPAGVSRDKTFQPTTLQPTTLWCPTMPSGHEPESK